LGDFEVFGLFKRRETLAERNRDKDKWALVVQSHGWLLDRIEDDDPWFKTYWFDKEISVKEWVALFEDGKSDWSKISMTLSISNSGVYVSYHSTLLGIDIEEKRWRRDFCGSDLKNFEEEILEFAAGLAVFQFLKIAQEDYQESLARGELRSIVAEDRIEMLNFLKAK
jgi:hypothetical protein